jgi:signal peptidase II
MGMSPAARFGLAIAVAVIAADQASKWWIITLVMDPPRVITLTPFFDLVMGWNRGISFGLFNQHTDWNLWVLPAVATVIVAVLLVWLWRETDRYTAIALGTIIGGALGNMIDRLVHGGAVADFIQVHAGAYYWPAFNLADSAISIGAVMLVWRALFGRGERTKSDVPGQPMSDDR